MTKRRVEIGGRLRECRKSLKLSQEQVAAELAELAGQAVSAKAVSAWESGERMPGAERLGDLCVIYGVASDFILFGIDVVPRVLRDLAVKAMR